MRTPIVLLAVGLLAAAPTPPPAQGPSGCVVTDAAATVIYAAKPNLGPLGGERHVAGTVRVRVSLNAESRVVATRIERSPSQILNPVALEAARTSTYQTAVHDCVPVASIYFLSVEFDTL